MWHRLVFQNDPSRFILIQHRHDADTTRVNCVHHLHECIGETCHARVWNLLRRLAMICAPAMTTRLFRLLGIVLVLAALSHPLGAMTQRDRSSYLDWMVKSLPSAPQFEQWQQRTGELPPDFDAFPRNNFLPDPLRCCRVSDSSSATRAGCRMTSTS